MIRLKSVSIGIAMIGLAGDGPRSPIEAANPPARPPEAARVVLFDPDPEHLWNRLYAACFVRTGPDGRSYGIDEPDPLHWRESKALLTEPKLGEVRSSLDEFLAHHGEERVRDPLVRAVFQHDLWAVFDWLADPDASYTRTTAGLGAPRRELRARLARVIRRLALAPEAIGKLPDNYEAAVASRAFPAHYDPDRPDEPFLPDDLMQASGPWVLLEERAEPVYAPQHVDFTKGRSAFLVFLNLPGGRKATLDYVERLAKFPEPLSNVRFNGRMIMNPEMPQFPAGTQVALARRMMLIDSEGGVEPSRLMESLQIRVYRDVPRGDPSKPELLDRVASKQHFVEFRLRRKDLFDGKAGGLHAVGTDEREFAVFRAHGHDPIDEPIGEFRPPSQAILKSCTACHNFGPGIRSVLSFHRFGHIPPDTVEGDLHRREMGAAITKQRHYTWGLLQGLWEAQPAP